MLLLACTSLPYIIMSTLDVCHSDCISVLLDLNMYRVSNYLGECIYSDSHLFKCVYYTHYLKLIYMYWECVHLLVVAWQPKFL